MDIGPSNRKDSVCHIQRDNLDVFYVDDRFVFYQAFTDRLIGELSFNDFYVADVLDMMRHPNDWTRYTMLLRALSDSKSILVNLTFIRDKNDRFSLERKS